MVDIARVLAETRTVLLVDWPSRDVPDTLTESGYKVFSCDGQIRAITPHTSGTAWRSGCGRLQHPSVPSLSMHFGR